MGFAPILLAIEDGCRITGPVLKMEPECLVRAEDLPMDPLSCKKRRQQRVEVLRRKRQRTGSFSETSSVVSSDDSRVSQPCYLTKDDMRRKKNRESAERSRLRKLALIDALTAQVHRLLAKHKDLKEENFRLRSLELGGKGPQKAVSTVDQLAMYRNYQFGHQRNDTDSDVSTLSSSSPQRASSPVASFSFESSAGMYDNNFATTDTSTVSSLACFFPSSSGSEANPLSGHLTKVYGHERNNAQAAVLKNGSVYTGGDANVAAPCDLDFAFDALCDLDFGEFFDGVPGLF